ncbi:MAG: hypothetical protein SFU83_15515, partial [Meiothermus sp.]|nr:hypothetical protein [Meiothermus sp.]
SDLRLVGYRGGDSFDPDPEWDASGLSDPRKFTALSWLRNNWGQLRLNGAPVPTLLSGTVGLGGYSVTNISWNTSTRSYRYDLQRTVYTHDRATRQLRREQDLLTCDQATLACTLDRDGQPEAMIEGLEALHVFFQSRTGAWSLTPPPAASLVRMAVYLRGRSPRPIGPGQCGPWPSSQAQLPSSLSSLGLSPVSYLGAECSYRRAERTLSVYVVNPQQY